MQTKSDLTSWRQGDLVTVDGLTSILPELDSTSSDVAIVVSHDCDLAREISEEPYVEVIVGRVIEKADGNYTHAKNSRRLHLKFEREGKEFALELSASKKISLKKADLFSFSPDASAILNQQEKTAMVEWLAARYRRSAFPDEFNRRLSSKLTKKIAEKIEPLSSDLMGIYFNLEQNFEILNPDELYGLEIYLLYEEDGSEERYDKILKLAVQIKDLFEKTYFDSKSGNWKSIELLDCTEISDHAMSIHLAARLQKWNNADHLSLRATPQQKIIG